MAATAAAGAAGVGRSGGGGRSGGPIEAAVRGGVDGLGEEEARQWICGSAPCVEAQGFAMAGAEGRLAWLPEG